MGRTEDVCWGYRAGSLTAVAVTQNQDHLQPTQCKWSVVCDCGSIETRWAKDMKSARARGVRSACRKCVRKTAAAWASGLAFRAGGM